MSNREYTPYQQKVIKRFYDNRDQIDDQRLSELVTNLYLTEGKKRDKMWEKVEGILERLDISDAWRQHILDGKDPAVLAELVKDLQAGKIRRK